MPMSPGDEVRWLDADELAAWVNLIKLASRVVTLSDTELLGRTAPEHVARVREWIIDPLDRLDLAHLARIAGQLNTHLRTIAPLST